MRFGEYGAERGRFLHFLTFNVQQPHPKPSTNIGDSSSPIIAERGSVQKYNDGN